MLTFKKVHDRARSRLRLLTESSASCFWWVLVIGKIGTFFAKIYLIRSFSFTLPSSNTAKLHQVRTKIFSPDPRYVPAYGSPQTGLCNKVWPKVRSVKYSKLRTKANSEFHLRMKQSELDVPYFWQYFVAKSSLGRSIRRFAPCVW